MSTFDVIVFDQFGNFTRTLENSDFNESEFAELKRDEGYSYNWIIGHIILLTKYHINIKISDVLTSDEQKSSSWKIEKEMFGEYWKT
jgi:hypothetical protein